MTPEQELIRTAANLARSRREEWQDFLRALHAHVEVLKDECISSPLDQLPVLQGRARGARELLKTLETCVQTADRIVERHR